jgi:RNA polymerase sigma-70 factor (ECF subfamily)
VEDSQFTRQSLLIRLGDCRDRQAWSDFVDLYSPVVYGYARRQGLQDADAADLVQEVLRSVTRSLAGYEPKKGRFRCWLMAVVRRRLADYRAERRRELPGSGDTQVQGCLEQVSAADDSERVWEQEYRQSLFRYAAARIRGEFEDSTWKAFWHTTVEGKKTREVAQSLGLSEGAVYIAKCRVTARLKKEVQRVED